MHIKAIQHEQCNYVLWMCWSLSIAVCLKCIETDVSLCSDHVPGVCGPMCISMFRWRGSCPRCVRTDVYLRCMYTDMYSISMFRWRGSCPRCVRTDVYLYVQVKRIVSQLYGTDVFYVQVMRIVSQLYADRCVSLDRVPVVCGPMCISMFRWRGSCPRCMRTDMYLYVQVKRIVFQLYADRCVSLCSGEEDRVPGVCGPMCICSGEEDPHGDFSCKLVDAGRCGGRCVPSAGTWWLGWCAVDYWDWTVTVALCLCLLNQYVSLAASTEAIIVYVITILSCFQWLVNVVHYFCTFVKCVFCHWTQRYFSH